VDNFATSSLRTAIGKMDLNDIFENRTGVTAKVMTDMGETLEEWGGKIARFEITDLLPTDREVRTALHKKATTEREKLEMTTMAEANYNKFTLEADATFYEKKKMADGYFYKMTKEGDGDYMKIKNKADAEVESIKLIGDAISKPGGDKVVKMRILQNYLDQFGGLTQKSQSMVVPAGMKDVASLITSIKTLSVKK